MSLLNPPLEAFLAIVESGTVHGAAAKIKLTQTGVTQRIRSLEKQLGTTLFIRSRKGMSLTSEGESLLHYCQSALALEGETLAKIHHRPHSALNQRPEPVTVTITGPTSIMRSRIIPQTFPTMKHFPQLLLHYKISDFEDWIVELKNAKVQIAIVPRQMVPNEVESKILPVENFILIGPRTWQKRPLEDIVKNERIIDFDPQDEMTFRYLEKYTLRGPRQSDRIFVNNSESLVQMIEAGLGYGVIAQEFIERFQNHSKIGVLNESKPYPHFMAACWYARPVMPDYFKAILDSLTAKS